MSLKHGILGLLTYGSMSGYELMKIFNESLSFFWKAQTSQIYRELETIEGKGWVTSQSIQQTGKPNKKILTLTDEGKVELQNWLNKHSASKCMSIRDEMTMRVFLSASADDSILIEELKEYYASNEKFYENLKTVEEELDLRINYIGKPEEKIYWRMAIKRGLLNAYSNMEWVKECLILLKEKDDSIG